MTTGPYQLVHKLGVGGMAEVYLARQHGIAGFEKLVVIKRILPQLRQDPQFVQMLLSEARVAAGLHHPNIVETYDVCRDETEFYLVMEYLSGEDLRFILTHAHREGFKIPVGVSGRIIADAAAGLHYAHRATDLDGNPLSIVHRDIGPTNLVLTFHGTTKLLDFGVAKANSHNIYTRPGVLKGKYSYCSPEQAQHLKLDARSDVFSLGIVLHELLTGRRLFRGKNPPEVLKAVVEAGIPAPSRYNPAVPPELDQLTLAALERNRRARVPSARELQEHLEHILDKHGLLLSAHQVSGWFATVLPEAQDVRRALEAKVSADLSSQPGVPLGGSPAVAVETPPPPPPTLTPSSPVSGAAPFSSQAGVSNSAYSGAPRSSQSHSSQGGAWIPASQLSLQPAPAPRRTGLVIVLSIIGTLLLVALMGGAVYLGMRDREPNAVAAVPGSGPPVQSSVALLVHVVPDGTTLTVNGKPWEHPVGVDGVLVPLQPSQEVTLTLGKPGYAELTETLAAPGRGTKSIYFTLQRGGTEPTTDRSDRSAGGTAPAPAASVPVSAPPRSPESQRAVARSAPPARRRASPRSAPRKQTGGLTLLYEPKVAQVVIDGAAQPKTHPLKVSALSEGAHRLQLSAPGYQPREQTIEIKGGQTVSLSVQMEKTAVEPARLDIVTSPVGAEVLVDTRARGRSPVMGLQVSPGDSHTISIRLEGYAPWSTKIELASGNNPPVVATLTKLASGAGAASSGARDVIVAQGTFGDEGRGRDIFQDKCNACHGNSASVVRTTRYTRAQWSRYFARARHARHGKLQEQFTQAEVADVKAYLVSKAADVESDTAAGVR